MDEALLDQEILFLTAKANIKDNLTGKTPVIE